jgi:replication initiation and membrane attachment protein
MIKRFEPLDQITIYASTNLNPDDVNVITLLYAPLIESEAYKLYMTLQSLLNRSSLTSHSLLHKEILDITGLNPQTFAEARLKLEAIGLLSTYKRESEYLFMLKSPLTAKGFLSDGVLGMYLYSVIGDAQFRRIQKLFQIPKVDKTNYSEITASFDDVYQSVEDIQIKNDDYIVDRRMNVGIKIKNYDFDFNIFQAGIAQTFLEGKRITNRFKTFIINIAYAYGFNESLMQEIYNNSLNNSGNFDYTICSKKAREKYAELHEKPLPKLSVKPENIMSETEELFQTLPAKTIIETSTGSKVATSVDVEKICQLYQEYSELPRSVINVCVVYAIKKCEGTVPAYGYFDTILKDWVNKGINTFKAAQETIERTNKNANNKKKKPSNDPEWLKEYVEKFEEGVEDL